MKLLFANVAQYPDFDLPKIYHGCGFKKSHGLRELIDHTSNETCISRPTWVTGSFVTQKDTRCLARDT